MNTPTRSCTLSLFALLAFCLAGYLPASAADGEQATAPEEMIVNAPTSLSKLRREINRAQEAMFDVFNEYNQDDLFDVSCGYQKRWQSKIRDFVCSPKFLKAAQEQEVNLFLGSIGTEEGNRVAGTQNGGPGVTQMDHMNAIFADKMRAMVREQQEFRNAVDTYNALNAILQERVESD